MPVAGTPIEDLRFARQTAAEMFAMGQPIAALHLLINCRGSVQLCHALAIQSGDLLGNVTVMQLAKKVGDIVQDQMLVDVPDEDHRAEIWQNAQPRCRETSQ